MRSRKVNTGGKIARPRAKFKPLLRKEKDKERGREREEKVSKLHCTESLFTWTTFGESITRRRFQPGDTQSPRKTRVLLHAPTSSTPGLSHCSPREFASGSNSE